MQSRCKSFLALASIALLMLSAVCAQAGTYYINSTCHRADDGSRFNRNRHPGPESKRPSGLSGSGGRTPTIDLGRIRYNGYYEHR
jgi:hypothetical protein